MKELLTYEQAVELHKIDDKVKNHIKDNYPDKYYGRPGNILGRFGHGLSKTAWDKVAKLAKNDDTLRSYVFEYKDKLKSFNIQ